jgi:hypothetical protein
LVSGWLRWAGLAAGVWLLGGWVGVGLDADAGAEMVDVRAPLI